MLVFRIVILLAVIAPFSWAEQGAKWGANYFPDYQLINHRNEKVRFFSDLIKDKVVVINFIYTSCPDACPLETSRLRETYALLGDRVGDSCFRNVLHLRDLLGGRVPRALPDGLFHECRGQARQSQDQDDDRQHGASPVPVKPSATVRCGHISSSS